MSENKPTVNATDLRLCQGRDDDATTSTSTGSRAPRRRNAQYYRDYRARKRAEQEKESLNRTTDPSSTADPSTINVAGSVTLKKQKSAAEYQREYRARKKAKRDIDSLAVIPSTSTGGLTTTHLTSIADQLTIAGPSINPPTTPGPSTSTDISFAKPTTRKTSAEYQREYRGRKKAQRESMMAAKTNHSPKFLEIYTKNENMIMERRKEFESNINIKETVRLCEQLYREEENLRQLDNQVRPGTVPETPFNDIMETKPNPEFIKVEKMDTYEESQVTWPRVQSTGALLIQQNKLQQEPDVTVGIATDDIRSAGASGDIQVPGPSEIRTLGQRAISSEATWRWREKEKSVESKKQAKTAAQRMREYRMRKKLTCAASDKSKDPLNTPTDSLENTAIQAPEAVMKNPLNIKVESDNPESDEHLSDRGIIIKEEIDIGKEEFSNSMANSYVSLPWTTDDGSRNTAEENRSVRQSVPVAVDGNLCLSVRPLNIKNTQREYLRMGPPIGRIIGHQAKQITYNLYNYFKDCKLDPDSLEHQNDVNLAGLVAYVTGMSESTVRNIVRLGRSLYENTGAAVFKPPKKNKQAKKRIEIDNFTEGVIRRKITQFYTVKQEIPTLRKMNSQLKQDGVLSCSREFLRDTLHRLGFRYKKFQCKRKLLIERSDITAWRWYYLLTIKKLRNESRPIFYLDETYVELSNNVASIGKGRLVIIHAGGRTGFVDNALMIYKAPSKLGDSHITSETFENYIKVHLLPNLPNNSVIVMDNAACHCKQIDRKPTITSAKNSMQEWLTKHDVPFDETMRKCNLMQLIDSQNVPKQYVVDEIINQAGHAVLRLPQNHSDLNPMEIVWGEIKRDLERTSDANTNIDQKQAVLENLFASYSAKQWSNCDDQVVKIEDYYYEDDMNYDDAFDRFVLTAFDDSDSEDKSGGSSDDEYTECDESD